MADDADLAQRHEEFRRELGLRAARAGVCELATPSAFGLCEGCGDPIEAERREALPAARRCFHCQEAAERRLRLRVR
ncbi:MAG: TraR/DksA C4-type zinc finger protein [Pseudomonadota bacterium]